MINAPTSIKKQYYEQLTQSVADALLILDHKGIITSANQPAALMLGYQPTELLEKPISNFWKKCPSPWDPEALADKCIDECFLLHQDQSQVPVRIAFSQINSKNQSSFTVLTITNLDDVKQLNQALSHTQRLASLGTLTASIAHELNTPTSIIAATCSNLLYEVEHNSLEHDQLLRYIQMIEQSAWRSARILEVLRNYSYNDAPQFDVTNLNMVVDDALTLVRHQFRGQYNIKIDKELDEDLPSLVCDHHRMTQVMLNLLINASDAIPDEGGVVKIKTWLMKTAACDQNPKPEEQFAFSIQDSGTGILPDIKDKIFKPFFTTKPHGKGTGLGLYIAKRIIDQHRGQIQAENNPEGGATFTVIIPRNLHATL